MAESKTSARHKRTVDRYKQWLEENEDELDEKNTTAKQKRKVKAFDAIADAEFLEAQLSRTVTKAKPKKNLVKKI